MKWLALDTSTSIASVALAVDDELYVEELDGVRQHALCLLPMIERLLTTAAISVKQLDGIVFGRGPGSFTGLRVACSIAKALAYAHDLALYPVSSLRAIADEVFYSDPQSSELAGVLALIDARMDQGYWAYFDGTQWDPEEHVTAIHDIVLPPVSPILWAGVYEGHVQREVFPHARAMLRLVQAGKVNAVSIAEALPVYIRNQVTQGERRG